MSTIYRYVVIPLEQGESHEFATYKEAEKYADPEDEILEREYEYSGQSVVREGDRDVC